MEPPVSSPREVAQSRAAVAAPEPVLETPGLRSKSQGLRAGPSYEFTEVAPIANSSICSFPMMTAPASLNRWATVESVSGMQSLITRDPAAVRTPFVENKSLSAMGMPCRGPL